MPCSRWEFFEAEPGRHHFPYGRLMIGTEEEILAILEGAPDRPRIQLTDPLNREWAEDWFNQNVPQYRRILAAEAKRARRQAKRRCEVRK